jgi:hypothetical protein
MFLAMPFFSVTVLSALWRSAVKQTAAYEMNVYPLKALRQLTLVFVSRSARRQPAGT